MKDKLRSLFIMQEARRKKDRKEKIKEAIGLILTVLAYIWIAIAVFS